MIWPAVSWIAPDGKTGARLFGSAAEAQRWGGDQWAQHPDWDWRCEQLATIPQPAIFTIGHAAVEAPLEGVRERIVRYFAARCDAFLVRDWGLASVAAVAPFGQVEGPDAHGLVQVTGRVTPRVAQELVRANWFELFLWEGDSWRFGLDDWHDVAFLLTEAWMADLEREGVARCTLVPEALDGHGYAFCQLARPRLEAP